MRVRELTILGLVALVALPMLSAPILAADPPPTGLGFNWDNAPKVYVLHWDQKSVKARDPSLPFRIARGDNVTLMRTWAGISEVIQRWRSDRSGTFAGFKRMLDDAQANGVRLIISQYLTLGTVEALAGKTYPDWASAQRDLATAGSAAWMGHMAWLKDLITAFGGHPAAYSWEATNEPGWMLGVDAGVITRDQAANWLNAFQKAMHTFGAARVNMGGSTFGSMTDAQLLLATQYTDILDDHFYPKFDGSGKPVDGNEGALLSRFQDHIARVHGLSGRDRSAIVGEYGTLPWTWFTNMSQALHARGWNGLAWEYDGWDQFWFNDTHRPEVLASLAKSNRPPPPPPPLSATFGTSPVAGPAPLPVELRAIPRGGTPPYSYLWSFGDGSTSGEGRVNHVFAAPGTYRVLLTVSDSHGQGAEVRGQVLVVAPLTLSLVVGPGALIAPSVINVSATVSGGMPPYAFHWALGDGSTADLPSLSHTYTSAGTYRVALTVTDSLGDHGGETLGATAGQNLTIVAPLEASLTADGKNGTVPLTVRFRPAVSGGSGYYTYRWDFGDGNGSTEQEPVHIYRTTGTYNATLEVRDRSGQTMRTTTRIRAVGNSITFPSPPPSPLTWVVAAMGSAALILAVVVRRVRGHRPPWR